MSPQSKLLFEQREEFRARARVFLERAEETGGFHDRVLFFDPAHHHAKMFCFHDNRDAVRLETIHQRFCDLRRQIFLDLQAPRKDVDNACDFRKSDHFAVWNVGHVRPPDEWQQMMLARSEERRVGKECRSRWSTEQEKKKEEHAPP